jgi:hypothetical protein
LGDFIETKVKKLPTSPGLVSPDGRLLSGVSLGNSIKSGGVKQILVAIYFDEYRRYF